MGACGVPDITDFYLTLGAKKLILTVSSLGGCGGLEKLIFNSFYFGRCSGLEKLDFKQFLLWEGVVVLK